MPYCMICGKETDNGTTCPECAAASASVQQVSIQPENVQPAAAIPAVKKKVNKAIVAMLSLLGVFAAMTAVVIGIFI